MLERILVPLDGSPLAEAMLPLARELARKLGGRLVLLHVAETAVEERDRAVRAQAAEYLRSKRSVAEKYLNDVACPLEDEGVPVEWVVLEGRAPRRILAYARETSVDLIAMATHSRGGFVRAIMGSVATRVLQAAHCPVLLARPRQEGQFWSIPSNVSALVVPLDGSRVAESALPLARDMASRLGVGVQLVRVLPGGEQMVLGDYATEMWHLTPPVAQRLDTLAYDYLANIGAGMRSQGLQADWEVCHGNAAGCILDLTRGRPDVMVVMTTHGYSGLRRWLIGSVADAVVRESGAPVLVTRPRRRAGESHRSRRVVQ